VKCPVRAGLTRVLAGGQGKGRQYAEDARRLTRDGAAWLADRQPALAGGDAVSIDDTADRERPARTACLRPSASRNGRGVTVYRSRLQP
jgi:hypothetical protein